VFSEVIGQTHKHTICGAASTPLSHEKQFFPVVTKFSGSSQQLKMEQNIIFVCIKLYMKFIPSVMNSASLNFGIVIINII